VAVLILAFATLLGFFSPTAYAGDRDVSVMTRNLYVGTGLNNVVAAKSFPEVVAAVTQDFDNVLANDFRKRAKGVATEIAVLRPDVVGLQEVSLWRQQAVADTVAGVSAPNADTVVFDHLELLQKELAARGAHYVAVATEIDSDIELPRSNPASPNGFSDVRITDREVVLVRAAVAARVSNPQTGAYTAQLTLNTPSGPKPLSRGWASIDLALGGRTVRILSTHLDSELTGPIQVAQGAEVLALAQASPYPVIVLGDFSSAADGSTTATAPNMVAGGLSDAWRVAQPRNAGRTCCLPERLDDLTLPSARIDYVFTRGPWRVEGALRTGILPFQLSAPYWASDHFGVYAALELK
jgi:endonuclease/exonuclease/phosphatase family metal-dependent hydrolase